MNASQSISRSGTVIRVALLFLATLLCRDAWCGTPWPTTEFRVDFSTRAETSSTGEINQPVLPDRDRASAPPAGADRDVLDIFGNRARAYGVLAMYFERSLNDAAEFLEAEGYEPPSLPLYRDENGGTFYRINVFDFTRAPGNLEEDDGVYYIGNRNCSDPNISRASWFAVNADYFVPLDSEKEVYLYFVLAHELVHAVQANYPATNAALNGCKGKTRDYYNVIEGTADALAFYLARRHWPEYYRKFRLESSSSGPDGEEIEFLSFNGGDGFVDTDLLGLRGYVQPFLDLSAASVVDRPMAEYKTSSFWFNVTDRYGFGFVDHLLRQPLGYGDQKSLFEWLDGALKSWKPNLDGLYTVFPHFVAEFASQAGSRIPLNGFSGYGPGREIQLGTGNIGGQVPGNDDEWRLFWIQRILGRCHTVELTAGGAQVVQLKLPLRQVSAACLDISWQGFNDNFELYLEAEHASLRLIDQVNIGLIYQRWNGKELYCYNEVHPHYSEPLWTCMHEKPFLTSGSQPLTYTKRWSETGILFNGDGHRLVAISNVARNAEDTRAFTDRDPLVVRVGIAESQARDGKLYDPPFSAFKGSPGMGMVRFDAESKYGITKAPTPAVMLLNFGLPVKGSEEQYGLSWLGELPALGYRGPFKGTITAPQKRGAPSVVSSMICKRHHNGEIGRVLRFDRDHLWIDIDADLCELKVPPPANGDFPVVDHVRASLRLPFGWQYDPASAPADIVTPGMQVFIDRYNKRLPTVLSGAWPTPAGASNPGSDGANNPAAPGGSQTGAEDDAGGSGSGSVLHSNHCTCSCEELAAFDEQAETAKKNGDNDAAMSLATEMMACTSQCQREYMLCRAGLSEE
ncbi:MAG: hypothetical protein WCH04_12520 [Gammaproteobacteria bacterium]